MRLPSPAIGTAIPDWNVSAGCTAQMKIDHGQVNGCLLGNSGFLVELLVLQRQLAQDDRSEVGNPDHVPKASPRETATRLIDQ